MKGNWKIRKYMEIKQRILKYREGNGTPLQYSCLEDPMDWGVWKAAAHGVVKSRAQLSDFAFTFHFHALEKEMATHSSVLAWRIPGTGVPGGLRSMGSHRVGRDWSDLAATAFLNHQCVKAITREIMKCFEMNENRSTTYQSLWHAVRAALREVWLWTRTLKKESLRLPA